MNRIGGGRVLVLVLLEATGYRWLPSWRQRRKRKALCKLGLPRDPFQRLGVINPLSLPLPAF